MATNPFQTQVDDLTKATQVKPVTTAFDEKKSTAGRVNSIIAEDSPLMLRAAAKAGQAMNARGLTNSSMAIGAGQAAVMDAATPIAQQDASLYQQAQIANQNSTNQGNQFNAATTADIGTKGMSLGESSRQFDTGEASKKDMFSQDLAQRDKQFGVDSGLRRDELTQRGTQYAQKLEQDRNMVGLDRDAKKSLIEAEAKYKTEIAGNENVANAWATTMRDISTIQNNPDLDDAAKATMIQNTKGGFESFAKFWKKAGGGKVDVSDLLNFSVGSAPAPGSAAAAPAAGAGAGRGSGPGGAVTDADLPRLYPGYTWGAGIY